MPISPISGIKSLWKKKERPSRPVDAAEHGGQYGIPPQPTASAWSTPGPPHRSPSSSHPAHSTPARPLASQSIPSQWVTPDLTSTEPAQQPPNAPYHQQMQKGQLLTPPAHPKLSSSSLGTCLKTFDSPLRQPFKDPKPGVPPELTVKPLMFRFWKHAPELKVPEADNTNLARYIWLRPATIADVDKMVVGLFHELDGFHAPGLREVLDYRNQGVQVPVRSGPLRNEWQLVGDEYADFVTLASEVLGRLHPNQSPALQTEIQLVSTESDSKIDLGIAFRTKGITATTRTVASTCEYKVEESFSDAALDVFDEFWDQGGNGGFYVHADKKGNKTAGVSVNPPSRWKTNDDLPRRIDMVERILMAAVQAVSYAYESHTRYGLFSNGNRHILVTYETLGLKDDRPAVFFSKSFGRRTNGEHVNPRPHGPNPLQSPPLLAYLLAIAHYNLREDRKAGEELGVDPHGRPLPGSGKDVHALVVQANRKMSDMAMAEWQKKHIKQHHDTRPKRTKQPPVNYSEDDTPGHTPVKHLVPADHDDSFNFTPTGMGAGWTPQGRPMTGGTAQSSAQPTSTGWMTGGRPSMLAGSMPPTPTPAPGGRVRPSAGAPPEMGSQARAAAAYAPPGHAAMRHPDNTSGIHGQSSQQGSAYGQPRSQMKGMPLGYSQPMSTPTPPRTAGGHARTYGDSPRRR